VSDERNPADILAGAPREIDQQVLGAVMAADLSVEQLEIFVLYYFGPDDSGAWDAVRGLGVDEIARSLRKHQAEVAGTLLAIIEKIAGTGKLEGTRLFATDKEYLRRVARRRRRLR